MSRRIRLWGKKRGQRRTGSNWLGSLSEAVFFALLWIVGAASFAALLTALYQRYLVGGAASDASSPAELASWGFWLIFLVVCSLMVIGGGGLLWTLWSLRTSRERRSALAGPKGIWATRMDFLRDQPQDAARQFPNIPRDMNMTNSPGIRLAYRLPSSHSPFWRLTLAATSCLVCTGLAAVFVVLTVDSLGAWRQEWVLYATTTGFVGLGGWSVYFFLRQLVLATSVGPTSVEISSHPFYPGESYEVFVSQAGRMQIRQWEVFLICEEEATYRQGTDVRVESKQVFSQQLVSLRNVDVRPGVPLEQLCQVATPDSAMHSFQSSHNAIRWKLVVRGRAQSRPVFERSFPVVVHLNVACLQSSSESSVMPRNGDNETGQASQSAISTAADTAVSSTASPTGREPK